MCLNLRLQRKNSIEIRFGEKPKCACLMSWQRKNIDHLSCKIVSVISMQIVESIQCKQNENNRQMRFRLRSIGRLNLPVACTGPLNQITPFTHSQNLWKQNNWRRTKLAKIVKAKSTRWKIASTHTCFCFSIDFFFSALFHFNLFVYCSLFGFSCSEQRRKRIIIINCYFPANKWLSTQNTIFRFCFS